MSRYKLSNQIFELGLDAQELSVYAYLCSIHSGQRTITGETVVSVKQSTIAQNCGIRSVQTVARILSRLTDKGLTERIRRSVKANRHKGTYSYAVKHLDQKSGYFFVDRHVFGMLVPRQMMIYLFLCKSYSMQLGICWNSYRDIAEQTGMKRELVIQTVNELAGMRLIVRCRRKSRENKRVFVDNHYQIVFFVKGSIRKKCKKRVRLYSQYNRTNDLSKSLYHIHYITSLAKCQDKLRTFFSVRGSP